MESNKQKTDVLIIDDDEMSGFLAVTYLKKHYSTQFIKNPDQVLPVLKNYWFRAILLDIDLGGGVRGEDLIRIIRDLDEYKNIPVIALTGFSGHQEQDRLLQSGFNAYLPKPYSKNDLLAILQKLLL